MNSVQRTTLREAHVPISKRESFMTATETLTGINPRGVLFNPHASVGDLPVEFHPSFRGATYAVFSYLTPIAWVTEDDEWVIPKVRYSSTTSKHQYRARYGASLSGLPYAQPTP